MRDWKEVRDQPLLQLLGTVRLAALIVVWLLAGWIPSATLGESLESLLVPLGLLIGTLSIGVIVSEYSTVHQRTTWVLASAGLSLVGVVTHVAVPDGYARHLIGATTVMLIVATGLLILKIRAVAVQVGAIGDGSGSDTESVRGDTKLS